MNNAPLVSVITVVYNGVTTIEQTIQSVLKQSYKNIEYIIIDGQSTDGTLEIVEKYKDFLAYFISEKDDGIYDAMNKGIRQAKGEIVGIINSDDWYESYAVEKVVKAFTEDSKIGVVYGKVNRVLLDGTIKEQICEPLEKLWYKGVVMHPTVFVRRSVYDEYGMFDVSYQICSDYDLLLRLYSSQVGFRYIDMVVANYRFGGASQIFKHRETREAYQITSKYMDRSGDIKDEVRKYVEARRKWIVFEDILEEKPEILSDLLRVHFGRDISTFIIFGVGMWGRIYYNAAVHAGLHVPCFLDNFMFGRNYAEEFCAEVKRPEDGFDKDFPVLIAMQNDADLVEKQLEAIGGVEYVSMGKIMERYFMMNPI